MELGGESVFCPKCGNKLPDQAMFCGECGHKVVAPNQGNVVKQPVQQASQPAYQPAMQQSKQVNKKPMPFVTKIIIAEVIALIICAGIFYTKIKEYTSPETVARTYFTAIMAGDKEAAYDMIEVEESDFVNEKYFGNVVEQIGCKNISNYKVKNVETESDDYTTEVVITYHLKEDTTDYSFYVKLDKSASKKLFFFDDWNVNVGDYIQKGVTLNVIEDSKVNIDGTELGEKYIAASSKEFGNVTYTIPKMFSGTYEAVITNDIYTDCNMSLVVNEYENSFYEGEDSDTVSIKSEIIDEISKRSQDDFKVLWNGAVQQTDFANLTNSMQMAEDREAMAENYGELASYFKREDGTGLKQLQFDNFEVSVEPGGGGTDYEVPALYVRFTAPFTCVEVDKDWWTGELEDEDSSGDYTGSMYYTYQNGAWVLTEISIANLYYY